MKTKKASGYTLVEVLLAMALGTVVLTATMSSFLMLGRSGLNIGNYNDMESQARVSLERFGQDVRQASGITWTSSSEIALTFPAAKTPNTVIYRRSGDTLVREVRSPANAVLEQRNLVTGVTQLVFTGYAVDGTAIAEAATPLEKNLQTKQLELSLRAARSSATVATATNTLLSARFILRNKAVSF